VAVVNCIVHAGANYFPRNTHRGNEFLFCPSYAMLTSALSCSHPAAVRSHYHVVNLPTSFSLLTDFISAYR